MNPNSGSIMYRFITDKRIIIYGDGEQTRDYISVRDVVSIIEDALKDKWNGKIVDVGLGEPLTTNYIAGLIAYYRHKDIEYFPPRREIKWSVANTAMLKTLYKKKLVDIEDGIKEIMEYYEGNPLTKL